MSRFEAFAAPDAAGLADLPTSVLEVGGVEVEYPRVDPAVVTRLATLLRGARALLLDRSAEEVVATLGRVGARFLDDGDPLRSEALALLPATSGLSTQMCELVLDGMARDWTEEPLRRLVATELTDPEALDAFVPIRGRVVMAVGPRLCVQIVAGSVPGVGVTALIRSLLVKAPTLLKPGLGDVVLPILFAKALRAEDARLADALAVTYWPGGSVAIEDTAITEAEVVTAYGSDETIASLRSRAPATTRFVPYHHRISVGAVGAEALRESSVRATAASVALAVSAFDQRGCVSPQVVYVEESEGIGAERFAEALAAALTSLEVRLPGGALDVTEASTLQQIRGTGELMAASGGGAVHHGGAGATWTVIVERDHAPIAAAAGRVVRLRPVSGASELPERLEPMAEHVQTLGVVGFGDRLDALAAACGTVGVSRVVPFDSVPFPPPWWHHDGRGPLTDLVRWAELERE